MWDVKIFSPKNIEGLVVISSNIYGIHVRNIVHIQENMTCSFHLYYFSLNQELFSPYTTILLHCFLEADSISGSCSINDIVFELCLENVSAILNGEKFRMIHVLNCDNLRLNLNLLQIKPHELRMTSNNMEAT